MLTVNVSEIKRHYVSAVLKHKKFADELISNWERENMSWSAMAETAKVQNDKARKTNAHNLLLEELYEAYAEYVKGDTKKAIYELYDAITVLCRMINFIEREEEKKNNGGK